MNLTFSFESALFVYLLFGLGPEGRPALRLSRAQTPPTPPPLPRCHLRLSLKVILSRCDSGSANYCNSQLPLKAAPAHNALLSQDGVLPVIKTSFPFVRSVLQK